MSCYCFSSLKVFLLTPLAPHIIKVSNCPNIWLRPSRSQPSPFDQSLAYFLTWLTGFTLSEQILCLIICLSMYANARVCMKTFSVPSPQSYSYPNGRDSEVRIYYGTVNEVTRPWHSILLVSPISNWGDQICTWWRDAAGLERGRQH